MRIKSLVLILLVAVFGSSNAGIVSAKQVRVIELVAKDGGSKIATIYVSDESILCEFNSNSDAVLFSAESFFTINNKEKTYRVQSYADLYDRASRKAAEIAESREAPDPSQGVELKLTDETDTISGLSVRKLIKTNSGNPETEFWVSSELLPPGLRAFGERIRSILPKDYWRRVQGNPGMVEIITLFGLPLKMINHDHSTYHAKFVSSSRSGFSFEVPAGYRRLNN